MLCLYLLHWRLPESIRNSAPPGLTISRLLFELNAVLPEDCLIVTSSGNSQAQVLQEYCFKKPGTHITTGGFSTMGFSLPAAIGAKLSGYDAPVVALMGDGDFYMSMQELSTAVQYNANIVVIVLNNYGWMAIRDLQLDMYGKGYDFGNDFVKNDGSLYTPCLSAIAESFGLFSQKVTRETETAAAVKRALDSGRPSFIEVIVEREYPASGGIATGWWDVPVPHYISAKESEYRTNLKDEYLR
jgi:acetolactate synthase-1/2/3 large subunit